MEYRRFGNTIYLRLDPKEEILEEIGKVAEKENIRLAQVTAFIILSCPERTTLTGWSLLLVDYFNFLFSV